MSESKRRLLAVPVHELTIDECRELAGLVKKRTNEIVRSDVNVYLIRKKASGSETWKYMVIHKGNYYFHADCTDFNGGPREPLEHFPTIAFFLTRKYAEWMIQYHISSYMAGVRKERDDKYEVVEFQKTPEIERLLEKYDREARVAADAQ